MEDNKERTSKEPSESVDELMAAIYEESSNIFSAMKQIFTAVLALC